MRYANHYILSELLGVLETGDHRAIKEAFRKYTARYREDSDLCRIGDAVIYALAVRNGTLEELKGYLRSLREERRGSAVRRCGGLLSMQASYR